jgi:hypothetical protein
VVIIFIINNLSPVYKPKKDAFLGKFMEILGKFIPGPAWQEFRIESTKSTGQ